MFELRNYQHAAIEALWTYWRGGGGNPLIDLATGLGKSFLIAELARRFCRHERRVLVLSHVREIILQDVAAIRALWPEAPIGINSAALGERSTDAQIVLATVQSVFRNPEALGARHLIMVDEAHLVPKHDEGMYRAAISGIPGPNMRVAGFSATPFRLDSGRLDEGEGRLFDRVVYRFGIREGIADGWLASLVAKAATEGAEISIRNVGKRGGEFIAGELEAAADQTPLVEAATAELVTQGADRRSWLAFCCGVDHARHVRDALRCRGIVCETIVGETPAGERRQIIEDFRKGRIRCLTGCNVFTTGFDVASVDLIAMLRPTCSPGLYVQMLGRGTRKAEGKQNTLVLDFAGNTARHGPVDTVTGDVATGNSAGGARAKICPECRTLVATGTKACPECGYEWPVVRIPRHDPCASSLSPLGGLSWLGVSSVRMREHAKPGRPPSLRVDYLTDTAVVSDWLAFEHSAGARFHATRKWQALGGRLPAPATVSEAMDRVGELKPVSVIAVQREGAYWRVHGVRTAELAP
jgi:DNA repair protein RadD